MVKLKTYCSKIGSGITPKGGDRVYGDSGTTLIRSQNVYNGTFSKDGLVFVDDEIAEKMKGVEVLPDDILLNITGDSVARCCKVFDFILPARVNQHVSIIRVNKDNLNPLFLMYYLISPHMQTTMLSLAGSGGTRKALTKAMIEEFEIPDIEKTAQDEISKILTGYDDLIENNLCRIGLLEESARLLYKEWFIHLRFPGHEHVRVVNGVPAGWERIPLGDKVVLKYGKALKAEERVDGTIPVYGSSGIVGTNDKALVKGPGIVLGRKGNVGSVFWSTKDFWAIDTVYYIDSMSSSWYLFYALKNMHFINTDVAVPGLNRDLAYSRPLLLPSERVLYQFLEVVTPMRSQIEKLDEINTKLREARDILLPRLMSGEIKV